MAKHKYQNENIPQNVIFISFRQLHSLIFSHFFIPFVYIHSEKIILMKDLIQKWDTEMKNTLIYQALLSTLGELTATEMSHTFNYFIFFAS